MSRAQRVVIAIGSVILLLLGVALLFNVRIHFPSRPVKSIDAITSLHKDNLNVVFILIDTLRADRLSAYGYRRPTSPTLKDIAASGIRFADDDAQSTWTKCSMASLWTGLIPTRTGVTRFDDGIPDAAVMPAEIFHKAGYTTVGIWRNGWVAPNFGFGQGFDVYLRPGSVPPPKGFKKDVQSAGRVEGTDWDLTSAARSFIASHRHGKFLLYLHYMDVHQYAYDGAAAKLGFGSSISDSYDASVHWVDYNVNEVLAQLDHFDMLKHTLVVVAADHGEGFREHGTEGHAQNVYEEVSHVPLIFMLPFRLPKPVVVKPTVRNVDIWPTILDIVGLPPLPDTDGRSLVPLIEAAAHGRTLPTPPAFTFLDRTWGVVNSAPRPFLAIRDGTHEVLDHANNPEKTLQIFDRKHDPFEQHNLVKNPPPWASQLRAEMMRDYEQKPEWGKPKSVHLNEMDRMQLKALGYVIGGK